MWGKINSFTQRKILTMQLIQNTRTSKKVFWRIFFSWVFFTATYYSSNRGEYTKNTFSCKIHKQGNMVRNKTPISRKVQKYLQSTYEQVSFRNAYLTLGSKLVLIALCIIAISLFLPWMSSTESISSTGNMNSLSLWSFSLQLWYVGFFVLSLLILSSFSILSTVRKEKIRFFIFIQISDILCCLGSSIIIFILCLQSYFYVHGLQMFSANIFYGKWLILCLSGTLVMFTGSLIMRSEYRRNVKGSYIHEQSARNYWEFSEETKNNMKLPF